MQPHDLLHIDPRPLWLHLEDHAAETHVLACPLVVVRRGEMRDGRIPIGIRGRTRSERYAAWLAPQAILRIDTPQDLLQREQPRGLSPFEALRVLRLRWSKLELAWGPTGSVGFALASGAPVVTAASDLDLQIRCARPLPREEALALLDATRRLAAPVDVQIETPHGAFALAEYALEARCMLRTASGYELVASPWTACA